jgi:hypothetical protein
MSDWAGTRRKRAYPKGYTKAGPVTVFRADGSITVQPPQCIVSTYGGKCRTCQRQFRRGAVIYVDQAGPHHRDCL